MTVTGGSASRCAARSQFQVSTGSAFEVPHFGKRTAGSGSETSLTFRSRRGSQRCKVADHGEATEDACNSVVRRTPLSS